MSGNEQHTPLTDERLAEIHERVERATQGPWETERSVSQAHNASEVHWSVRTHDKLPAHPWSPRYILWMCGLLWEARGSHEPRMRWCPACEHMHYEHREVPVDLRSDPEIEADATFIAAAREDVPALLAEVDRLRLENEALTLMGTGTAQMATGAYERLRRLQDENARLLEFVQQVAKGPTMLGIATMYLCNFCDVYVGGIFGRTDHRADCPITKARAFLKNEHSMEVDA